jgi:hypothetical protein
MPKPALAITLALVLAAAVYAQTVQVTSTDIFNTQKAQESVNKGVSIVRSGLQLGFLLSIGGMIFIIFKNVVLEQSGIPGVFRDRWFWVPFSLFAILLGFWLVAQFSAPVEVMYKQLVGDNCPLYWCP